MLKISLDNPFVVPLVVVFFGLVGYVSQVYVFNEFDILFVFLMLVLFLFLILLAEYIERKKFPLVVSVNEFFCWFVFFAKLFFLIIMISSGPVSSFDDRLSVFGNSFLLGINNSLSIFLFPLIPALTKNRLLFWSCVILWAISSFVILLYAPSKSFPVQLLFSLLSYRFLRRKFYGGKERIPLFSTKSIILLMMAMILTYFLVYSYYGSDAIDIIMHRAAYNYDIAIYISTVYESSRPDHGILYYSILPLLKQFSPGLYELQFFSIPQWVLYEALGIDRYGRYGYPNDNLAAGLLISYGMIGFVLFISSLFVWFFYVIYTLKKNMLSIFFLYLIFQIPLFYSSLQEFSIYFLVISLTYFSFYLCVLFFKCLRSGVKFS